MRDERAQLREELAVSRAEISARDQRAALEGERAATELAAMSARAEAAERGRAELSQVCTPPFHKSAQFLRTNDGRGRLRMHALSR